MTTDTCGPPIFPGDLKRLLGVGFVSASQLRDSVDTLTMEQAKTAVKVMVESGVLQPWLAPECPNCENVWPAYLGEDDIPDVIKCPFCGHETPEHLVPMYEVYEALERIEDE